MSTPIFVLDHVPGATETVRWVDIHDREGPFVVITYEPLRDTGRWTSVTRKRPYAVYWRGLTEPLVYRTTLKGAIDYAHDYIGKLGYD